MRSTLHSTVLHAHALWLATLVVACVSATPALGAFPVVGQWEEIAGPAPRTHHAAVYDPIHDRMIVVGGEPKDSWIIQFGPQESCQRLVATGAGPDSVINAAAVWDSKRNRALFILLDEYHGDPSHTSRIWSLELEPTPRWTLLSTTGVEPLNRRRHAAAYDELRDRVIVYGGETPYSFSPPSYLSDIWALQLTDAPGAPATWINISPGGTTPLARSGASLVIDSVRDRAIVFGGSQYPSFDSNVYSDVWALHLDGSGGWQQLSPSAPYSGRTEHTAIFDPIGNRMIVFGGINRASLHYPWLYNDLSQLSFGSPSDPETFAVWKSLSTPGPSPGPRYGHAAMLRTPTREMVVFGGAQDFDYARKNEVWKLALDSPQWTKSSVTSQPPSERRDFSMIFDARRGKVVVFGGIDGDFAYVGPRYYGDLWSLDLPAGRWSLLSSPTSPAERCQAAAIYDPPRDRMLLLGGNGYGAGIVNYEDLWSLGLADGGSWNQLFPSGPNPTKRSEACAVYDSNRDRMIVLGGRVPNVELKRDVWELSLQGSMTWNELHPSGTFPNGASVAAFDAPKDRILVMTSADHWRTWALNLAPTPSWVELPTVGAPGSFGTAKASIYDSITGQLIVFTDSPRVWALDVNQVPAVWSEVVPTGTRPSMSGRRSAIYDASHDRIVLFSVGELSIHEVDQYSGNRTWALNWGRPVPALATLMSAESGSDVCRITWWVPDVASPWSVERREEQGVWETRGTAAADPSGNVTFEDHDIEAGHRYGYRVVSGGIASGEVWLEVGNAATLSISGALPNPARQLSLVFSLPKDGPATLTIFDLQGRTVLTREIGGFGRGSHVLRLPETDRLASGVYLVRVGQGSSFVAKRVTLLH